MKITASGYFPGGQARWPRVVRTATVAALLLGSPPAGATMSVVDSAANSQMIKDAIVYAQMAKSLAENVTLLSNLANLQTLAGTVLGETTSPALGQLFTELSGAYQASNRAYGGLMAIPARFEAELAVFQPPAGGWDTMTFPDMMYRAQRMRALVGGTSAAAVANQAEALQRQAERAEQIRLAGTYGQNAKSAVAATQAAVQVLQGISQQLDSMERINAEMAQAIELHIAQQVADQEAVQAAAERDQEALEKRLTVGPATPKVDPLHW